MKKEFNNNTFKATEANVVLKETKENMVVENINHPKTSFNAADLWNVQKMKRDRVYRRYF